MLVMEDVEGVVNVDMDLEQTETETELKRELRDLPPAHYLFKIENFSLLSDAKIDSYESSDFEVGGYKWKLCVYPKGNKTVNEKGYLSMYLMLSESNSLPFHHEVNVSFKLFVYNQILDKYLAVQDAKERVKRFRGTVKGCGFDQFIPLDIFNDSSNGYLINDCCIFGAEIFVLESTSKGECASIVKKLVGNKSTFTWNIENYGKQKGKYHSSPEFVIGGFKWTLRIYPNGWARAKGKSLSAYLCLEDSEALDFERRLHVRYIIGIRDQIQEAKDHEQLGNKQYSDSSSVSGFQYFMPLSYLKEPSQGYVNSDGTMVVELQILILTLVKDFS